MRKSFNCSYDRIELIITYSCNMPCNNCDAMVPQAPSKEAMTSAQIEKFIKESIEKKIHWRHIRILGGEPTLHKDIFNFLDILLAYKKNFSPETKIQLVTNGYGKAVQEIIKKIPKEVEIENSDKKSNLQPTFSPVNQAPMDMIEYKDSDFSKGCWIPSLCGIALDMHGYYPCSAAAAIDRVFGFDKGKKELPIARGTLEEMFKDFCKLCGHFYDKINDFAPFDINSKEHVLQFEEIHQKNFLESQKGNFLTKTITSPTWENALEKYEKSKPSLSKY